MIDILRIINGTETIVCRVATNDASVVNEIMGREEVTVNITVESPLAVETGDFIRVDGTVYTLNREPDFEKASDVEYRYNLLFESSLYRMLDKLFTNPLTGISKFSVSRTLSEFVRLLTENMNKIDSGWSVSGDIPASEPKNLTFDTVSCREVLNRLSGEFGAEYFLTGKTIHFTERIENKTDLVFEQGKGKGLYSIGQEPVDSENTVTRIFPYGGTQNMTPGKGDASGRLFLPEGYLENFTEYGKVVEKEVEFQDVFPRFTGSADSVSGEFNNVVRCSSINFDVEKKGVGDTKIKINFLSGDLMGETFEFGWNNTNKEVTLIRKEDETALPGKDGKRPLIPHALKKAKSGDSFNFTDLLMPDEYMASAIVDLRAKATEWLAYYSRSRVKYSLEVDHRYLRGKRTLKAGDLVTIKIPETGTEKLLRVVSAERNLHTGKLSCSVSNYLDEKWSKKIEGAISDLKSNVTGSGSGGGLKVDILKENDLTPASDLNIYSSKRSVKEIGDKLSRVKADSAEEHITFKKGAAVEGGTVTDTLTASGKVVALDMEAGNNIKSKTAEVTNLSQTKDLEVAELARIRDLVVTRLAEVLNLSVTDVATLARTIVKESISSETFIPGFAGEGFKIWQLVGGDWTGEFDSITIRKTLTAFELLISKIRAVKGSLAITQANGKIKKVLDQSPVYSLEIDNTMSFSIGDLVRCQTWQSTGSKYYWVTVVRVEGNSIICNQAEFNGVVPAVGDELVQMGHVSDPSRQSMVYLDASSGRPAIDVLSGISTKSFDGKLKVRVGCLDGITDTDFPSGMKPSGYGLYCTNGFFKGMFVLRSGKTVEDYTGELVDTLQIGVRNLVKNSSVNETSNAYGFGTRYLTTHLEAGKTYTFVVNGRIDQQTLEDNKYLGVYLYEAGWVQHKSLRFDSVVNETKQVTFTLSKTLPVPDKISSYLHPAEGSRTGQVTINWYMLFEGNKAPDNWIEAPEDTAEKIQAAQDTANRANGAITRIDTELSALPGEITAAVTKITTAYTDNKIADIQIGSVNLLSNSAVERHGAVGIEYLNLFDPTGVFDRLGIGTYTISFDAKSAIEGDMHFYSTPGVVGNFKYVFKTVNGVDVTSNGIFGVNFNVTTEYKRYVFVVEIMGSNPASVISSVSLYGFYGSGKVPYVKNIKFEQGNKATGWSPAPEDSAAALKSVRTELDSRLTVTEQNITQKVSQSDFNALGQRVQTAEASIKTQADKIALTVTKEEFGNLQMSGRNVFRASGNFSTLSQIDAFWCTNGGGCTIDTDVLFNGHNTIRSIVGTGIHGIWYKLENGVEYTYSAMIRSNENYTGDGVTPLHYWAGKDNVSQSAFRVIKYDTSLVAGVWKLIYVTFKLINDANSFHPFIYAHANGTRVFNIAFMCLTKGNVPMINWEPAIEDVNDTLAKQEARIVLTEEGITSQAGSINGLTGRMNAAEQKITPEAITFTVKNNVKVGSRNYLYGSRLDNLAGWQACDGTFNLVTDEKMGTVVEYSRPQGGGDYLKHFSISPAELSNTDLVYFVIAKQISASGTWAFGGWSATVNKLTVYSDKIDLGDGWYQYWCTFKSGDTIGGTFGINSIAGTWRFYAAGVLKGTAPTDWTPAPEDTSTKISEMEGRFEVREDQISAKVIEVTRKALEASNSATSASSSAFDAAGSAVSALSSATASDAAKVIAVEKASEAKQTAEGFQNIVTEVTTAAVNNAVTGAKEEIKSQVSTEVSQSAKNWKVEVMGTDKDGNPNTILAAINADKSGVKIEGDKVQITGTLLAQIIMAQGLNVNENFIVHEDGRVDMMGKYQTSKGDNKILIDPLSGCIEVISGEAKLSIGYDIVGAGGIPTIKCSSGRGNSVTINSGGIIASQVFLPSLPTAPNSQYRLEGEIYAGKDGVLRIKRYEW